MLVRGASLLFSMPFSMLAAMLMLPLPATSELAAQPSPACGWFIDFLTFHLKVRTRALFREVLANAGVASPNCFPLNLMNREPPTWLNPAHCWNTLVACTIKPNQPKTTTKKKRRMQPTHGGTPWPSARVTSVQRARGLWHSRYATFLRSSKQTIK